jgi:large subunit ribosomal protein L17
MILKKLHRKKSNRELLFRNQVTSLLLYEKITTTKTKAKITKALTEKIITKAKTGTLNDKRFVYDYLCDKKAAEKLFKEILPRMSDRKSGYLRNISLDTRLGDGAEVQILQFIDYKPVVKPKAIAEVSEEVEPTKAQVKHEKKIEKLTKDQTKGEVTTIVRKKGERRISNEK